MVLRFRLPEFLPDRAHIPCTAHREVLRFTIKDKVIFAVTLQFLTA